MLLFIMYITYYQILFGYCNDMLFRYLKLFIDYLNILCFSNLFYERVLRRGERHHKKKKKALPMPELKNERKPGRQLADRLNV